MILGQISKTNREEVWEGNLYAARSSKVLGAGGVMHISFNVSEPVYINQVTLTTDSLNSEVELTEDAVVSDEPPLDYYNNNRNDPTNIIPNFILSEAPVIVDYGTLAAPSTVVYGLVPETPAVSVTAKTTATPLIDTSTRNPILLKSNSITVLKVTNTGEVEALFAVRIGMAY